MEIDLKHYKLYVKRKLDRLKPIFARAALGDYSRNLKIPDQEDEFLDLFVGIQIMLEVIRDQLQELRSVNEGLERLNRRKSEFISIISHELRTPLNAVQEGIHIVLDGLDGPVTQAQSETLGIARENVDRLSRMLHNVLTFTKSEVGLLRTSSRKTEMTGLLASLFELMKPAVLKKGLDFSFACPKGPVWASCDPDKIQQAVINLIDNALKFTEKGKIQLRLFVSKDRISLSVSDAGIGIPKKDQKKILRLFSRGESVLASKMGGSGIGLAVCKEIMDHHQGKILIQSRPRRGSRFTLSWPRQAR